MIIYKDRYFSEYDDEYDVVDDLMEKAFSDGYEYAQREFAKRNKGGNHGPTQPKRKRKNTTTSQPVSAPVSAPVRDSGMDFVDRLHRYEENGGLVSKPQSASTPVSTPVRDSGMDFVDRLHRYEENGGLVSKPQSASTPALPKLTEVINSGNRMSEAEKLQAMGFDLSKLPKDVHDPRQIVGVVPVENAAPRTSGSGSVLVPVNQTSKGSNSGSNSGSTGKGSGNSGSGRTGRSSGSSKPAGETLPVATGERRPAVISDNAGKKEIEENGSKLMKHLKKNWGWYALGAAGTAAGVAAYKHHKNKHRRDDDD